MICDNRYLGQFDDVLAAATCYKSFVDGTHSRAASSRTTLAPSSREGADVAVCSVNEMQPDMDVLCKVIGRVTVFILSFSRTNNHTFPITIPPQLNGKSPCDACLVKHH